ncbi:MAG: hypothetical protein MI757_19840 [Pirellulales bacterium]|nr:hypothetical protein [Pirellulales bacterium]
MKRRSKNTSSRKPRRGMLTLEWIFLITLLSIGLVTGLSAVRNSLLDKMADLCECIENLQVCDEPDQT